MDGVITPSPDKETGAQSSTFVPAEADVGCGGKGWFSCQRCAPMVMDLVSLCLQESFLGGTEAWGIPPALSAPLSGYRCYLDHKKTGQMATKPGSLGERPS